MARTKKYTKLKETKILEFENIDSFDNCIMELLKKKTIDEGIAVLQELKNKVPERYQDSAYFSIGGYYEYTYLHIAYDWEESDEEFNARVKELKEKEKQRNLAKLEKIKKEELKIKAVRKKLYEELKEEFE